MDWTDLPAVNRLLKKAFRAQTAPIIELIEAQTHDPFCVLVGTILSARTKDACTAGAVRRLFARMGGRATPEALENIPLDELEKLIYPAFRCRPAANLICILHHCPKFKNTE